MKGLELIFKLVGLINIQSEDVREIVTPVVQRNAFGLEIGSVLCAMLASDSRDIRERGVKLILQAKLNPNKPRQKLLRGIRKLVIPKINWDAQTWPDLINFAEIIISVPDIILKISDEDLKKILDNPYKFPKLPLHSTSVERAVRIVSESSEQVFGHDKRHEAILQKLRGRQMIPTFNTKFQLKVKK